MAYGKCLLGVIEYAKGLGSDEKDIKNNITINHNNKKISQFLPGMNSIEKEK